MTPEMLRELGDEARRLSSTSLRTLLAEPDRFARYSRRVGPLLLDLSKQRLDDAALARLGAIAAASGWEAAREAMFRGDAINRSENRAVLHTALRAGASRQPSRAPASQRPTGGCHAPVPAAD